jgi:steroid 5-alpha reductase family enzyme
MDLDLATLLPLLNALAISIAVQVFFFIFAAIRKTDMFTDLSYGITFVIVSWLALFSSRFTAAEPKWIIILLISIWGVRLAGYLFMRILSIKKDRRFDGIREDPVRFALFWLFQGISVWVILLPALVFIIYSESTPISMISWIGALIALAGIIIETITDQQKFDFKNENPGKWTDVGLWRYSRHPNYFGEMLVWWGIFVFVLPYLEDIQYLSVAGPIWITTLLLFITGIPTIESRYDEKYADSKEYQEYKKGTSLLIPLPKKR